MNSDRKRRHARPKTVAPHTENRNGDLALNPAKQPLSLRRIFSGKTAKLMAAFTVVYVVCCAALFWRYYPDPSEANLRVVEGIPTIYKTGSARGATSTIEIEGITFSCRVSPIGPSVSCPIQLHRLGVSARALFFYARTIQDDLVKNRPSGSPILMRLSQSDFTVWAQDEAQIYSKYSFLSLFDFGILLILPLTLVSVFLSPKKR